MTPKIMFVCLGNICRSPTAEGVFRGLAHEAGLDVIVDSSGTGGWHVGEQPDQRAMAEAKRRGYDLSAQRSRQVLQEDFERFDLILAMDQSNLKSLKSIAPCGHKAKVELFLKYAQNQTLKDVPDPYYEDNFEAVFDLIETASRGLIKALS